MGQRVTKSYGLYWEWEEDDCGPASVCCLDVESPLPSMESHRLGSVMRPWGDEHAREAWIEQEHARGRFRWSISPFRSTRSASAKHKWSCQAGLSAAECNKSTGPSIRVTERAGQMDADTFWA